MTEKNEIVTNVGILKYTFSALCTGASGGALLVNILPTYGIYVMFVLIFLAIVAIFWPDTKRQR